MSRRRTRTRRHRRQQRAALKYGKSAKPRHALKAGRTGKVHSTKIKSIQDRCSKKPQSTRVQDAVP